MFLPSIGKSGRVGTRAKPATLILFYGRTLASLIRLQRLQLLHHTKHCGQNCQYFCPNIMRYMYLLSKSAKILWKCKKLLLEHYQFFPFPSKKPVYYFTYLVFMAFGQHLVILAIVKGPARS